MTESRGTIDPGLRIGPVHLTVADLDRVLAFYVERLGFVVRSREDDTARLGTAEEDLLVLWRDPRATRVPGTTGLYHFAVLFPSRPTLGRALARLFATGTHLVGAADHGVSEAIYLDDPEGNGIEIYRDRPREEWPMGPEGIQMVNDPLDLDDLIAEHSGAAGASVTLPAGTRIGHVHLRVAEIDAAERFYVEALGFDRVVRFRNSALFVSAGGYHHHVACNTWAGIGAPPPAPGAQGLRHFVLELTDRPALDAVMVRARHAGVAASESGEGLGLADPSSNRLVFTVRAHSGARSVP